MNSGLFRFPVTRNNAIEPCIDTVRKYEKTKIGRRMSIFGNMRRRCSEPLCRVLGIVFMMLFLFSAVSGSIVSWQLAKCHDSREEVESNGPAHAVNCERRSNRLAFQGRRPLHSAVEKFGLESDCHSRFSVARCSVASIDSPQLKLPLRC